MKTHARRSFLLTLALFAVLSVLFFVAFSRPAHAAPAPVPSQVPPPPPELVEKARQAAERGQGFQWIPPTYSSDTATATGPNVEAAGTEAVKVAQKSETPIIGNVGPNGTNGRAGASSVTASLKNFAPFDPSGTNIAGWSFCAAGIGIFVASVWFPKIPKSAGLLSIGVGLVLLLAPTFLHDNPLLAVIAVGLIGLAIVLVVGYKAKWFDHAVGSTVQTKLINDGDPAGAGALAHIQLNAPGVPAATRIAASRVVKAASDHLDKVEAALAPKV